MTGPQDQAPIPPVTKPVTYEELTLEHKQKYDEVKAQLEADLIGSLKPMQESSRGASRYSPVGFDRQHILARPVGPSSATTSTVGMTGPQNQAPVPPATNPVTYEELTPEHQQKYDEVKAQF